MNNCLIFFIVLSFFSCQNSEEKRIIDHIANEKNDTILKAWLYKDNGNINANIYYKNGIRKLYRFDCDLKKWNTAPCLKITYSNDTIICKDLINFYIKKENEQLYYIADMEWGNKDGWIRLNDNKDIIKFYNGDGSFFTFDYKRALIHKDLLIDWDTIKKNSRFDGLIVPKICEDTIKYWEQINPYILNELHTNKECEL